jgi:hypothetical protein
MTTQHPSLDGSITTISLPLFLVILTRSRKSQEIFILTNPRNIVIKVDTYKTQTDLTQCYNASVSATYGSTANSPQDVSGAREAVATKNALKGI